LLQLFAAQFLDLCHQRIELRESFELPVEAQQVTV
jgi:hypothetical protein